MKRPTMKKAVLRFKRYSRAAYAAFCSLHREVTIGRVATYIADRQVRKSAVVAAVAALALAPVAAVAQEDADDAATRTLPELQVLLPADSLFGTPEPAAVVTAEEINQSSVRTVGDLLALLPAVDMRRRGVGDVQADLSMRGGTFDQMIVLLGGINITDAQTGHHNMDLPIDVDMVQRVELLSPSQLMARGVVAFCGAVNIVVADDYRNRLLAQLAAGSYGTADASLLLSQAVGAWQLTAAASYHRSDGYIPNTDYRHGSLYLHAARHSERDDWQLQLGAQGKAFGSYAFYSTSYPDQYEATRTLVGSAFNVHRWGALRSETALYGRLHADRFELFRTGYAEAPAWYAGHNHHLADLAGLRSRVVARAGIGELVGGVDLRREGIWSNVLGEPDSTLRSPYTKSAARLGATLFGGYRLERDGWELQGVALGMANSRFGGNYGFSADAVYRHGRMAYRGSLSRTFRLPTFTDLYYQSVNQRANPDLAAESSLNAEVGLSGSVGRVSFTTTAYYRAGSNIIDWVRRADEEVWYSMNHTAVDAVGADLWAVASLGRVRLRGSYSWCHIAQDAGELISGSALEYLRHKASLWASVELTRRLTLKGEAAYRYREGVYTDADGVVQPYGGVMLVDAEAEYRLRHTVLTLSGYNLLNRRYRDHGGVVQPGTTVMAGVRVELTGEAL